MAKPTSYTELLSTLVEEEFIDTFLYLKEGQLFKKKVHKGEKLSEIFNRYSIMELRHADILTTKLLSLGIVPRVQLRYLETETSLHSVLARHRTREHEVIDLYTALISMADEAAFAITLKGIREDEREHFAEVTHILDRLRG